MEIDFFFQWVLLVFVLLAEKTPFPFKSRLAVTEGNVTFELFTNLMVTDTDAYRISEIYFPILNLILLR